MKILLVNDFAGDGVGGAEAVVKTIFQGFYDDHKVKLFHVDGNGWCIPRVRGSAYPEPDPKVLSRVWNLRAKRQLQKLVDEWEPDVIHYHNVYARLSPAVFTVKTMAKKVLTLHDYRFDCPNARCKKASGIHGDVFHVPCDIPFTPSICALMPAARVSQCCGFGKAYYQWFKNKLFLSAVRHIDAVVAPSMYMRDYFKETTGVDSIWIPNSIDAKSMTDYSDNPVRHILLIGRLVHEKGFQDALADIVNEDVSLPTVVVGDGPMLEELQKKYDSTKIVFTGRLSKKEDIEEFYKDALVWVPSIWHENASIVLLESMAYGRPSLATQVGGNKQYANILYGNHSSIDKVIGMGESALMRLGKESRETVLDKYSIEKFIKQHEELYGG